MEITGHISFHAHATTNPVSQSSQFTVITLLNPLIQLRPGMANQYIPLKESTFPAGTSISAFTTDSLTAKRCC